MRLIKGKPFSEAMAILEFKSSPTADKVRKVLQSAGANAEENHNMVKDALYVHSAVADDGPILKRFRPRAMGRAYRIRKRTSHLTIVLSMKTEKRS
jgi:large subunit ribosomal protein L22